MKKSDVTYCVDIACFKDYSPGGHFCVISGRGVFSLKGSIASISLDINNGLEFAFFIGMEVLLSTAIFFPYGWEVARWFGMGFTLIWPVVWAIFEPRKGNYVIEISKENIIIRKKKRFIYARNTKGQWLALCSKNCDDLKARILDVIEGKINSSETVTAGGRDK
jgi:hypothetical protein